MPVVTKTTECDICGLEIEYTSRKPPRVHPKPSACWKEARRRQQKARRGRVDAEYPWKLPNRERPTQRLCEPSCWVEARRNGEPVKVRYGCRVCCSYDGLRARGALADGMTGRPAANRDGSEMVRAAHRLEMVQDTGVDVPAFADSEERDDQADFRLHPYRLVRDKNTRKAASDWLSRVGLGQGLFCGDTGAMNDSSQVIPVIGLLEPMPAEPIRRPRKLVHGCQPPPDLEAVAPLAV